VIHAYGRKQNKLLILFFLV